jgi:hypothetical protein
MENSLMSWFDDARNESEAIRSRSARIYEESENIYDLLWGAVAKEVQMLHNRNQAHIFTGGTPHDRFLRHQVLPSMNAEHHATREMHITLSADKSRIMAVAPRLGDYGPSNVIFDLEVLQDGVIRLMHEHEPIEIQNAAIMVVRNFLFPDLPFHKP